MVERPLEHWSTCPSRNSRQTIGETRNTSEHLARRCLITLEPWTQAVASTRDASCLSIKRAHTCLLDPATTRWHAWETLNWKPNVPIPTLFSRSMFIFARFPGLEDTITYLNQNIMWAQMQHAKTRESSRNAAHISLKRPENLCWPCPPRRRLSTDWDRMRTGHRYDVDEGGNRPSLSSCRKGTGSRCP